VWTVAFVVVNQVAYTVVVRLASSGTAEAAAACGTAGSTGSAGTGYTVYAYAFLLVMVPHSVATVSLATAALPRLSRSAADGDLRGLAGQLATTTRTALALVIPFATLLPSVALPVANLVFGYGASSDTYVAFASALALFAPGLVFFTVHYLTLRGFYALERTRTVFHVQCLIAAVNIGVAVVATRVSDPSDTAPALVTAYAAAYAVGAVASFLVLRRVLGGLETPALLRFLVRILLAAGVAGAVAWGWRTLLTGLWPLGDGKGQALALLGSTAVVHLAVLLLLARLLRIAEVAEVVGLFTRRVRR
jgi:putative peptidoglycan lipid II flippase